MASRSRRRVEGVRVARPKKTLSLKDAVWEANQAGLLGDYYTLDDDDLTSLLHLLERTKWRQSTASKNAGQGLLRAFQYALKRKLPKSKLITDEQRRRAKKVYEDAIVLTEAAYRNGAYASSETEIRALRGAYRNAADTYFVASDMFEDNGDMSWAVHARKQGERLVREIEQNFPAPSRDRGRLVPSFVKRWSR